MVGSLARVLLQGVKNESTPEQDACEDDDDDDDDVDDVEAERTMIKVRNGFGTWKTIHPSHRGQNRGGGGGGGKSGQ